MNDRKVNISYACDKWSSTSKIDHENRYCSNCDKIIHDFSKSKEKVNKDTYCGHFDLSQISSVKTHFDLSKTTAFTVSLLSIIGVSSISNQVYSQSTSKKIENKLLKTNIVIKGVVKDLVENESLPFTEITVFHNSIEIEKFNTDIDGYFDLSIDTNKYNIDLIELKFQYVGYDEKVLRTINLNKKESVVVINLESKIPIGNPRLINYHLTGLIGE